MAQETALEVDMVGLLRRKVQVVMRDYSFSEYQKDHVSYVIGPNVLQRINYSADTCRSIQFFVESNYSEAFEKKLRLTTDSVGADFQKVAVDRKIQYTIAKRVRPKPIVKKKKKPKNSSDPEVVELTSSERVASDERYFKVQKRTEADNKNHVKVLGWNKGKGQ